MIGASSESDWAVTVVKSAAQQNIVQLTNPIITRLRKMTSGVSTICNSSWLTGRRADCNAELRLVFLRLIDEGPAVTPPPARPRRLEKRSSHPAPSLLSELRCKVPVEMSGSRFWKAPPNRGKGGASEPVKRSVGRRTSGSGPSTGEPFSSSSPQKRLHNTGPNSKNVSDRRLDGFPPSCCAGWPWNTY